MLAPSPITCAIPKLLAYYAIQAMIATITRTIIIECHKNSFRNHDAGFVCF
jgi:hypothetical protein